MLKCNQNVYPNVKGYKLIRKPGKVFLNNTNLLHAITGSLRLAVNVGNSRETFFVNQVSPNHKLNLHERADFMLDDHVIIEVGGRSKSNHQLKSEKNGYLALDNIEVGYQHKLPLYLFGFLY